MLVFRIENSKGLGPYNQWINKKIPQVIIDLLDSHCLSYTHPDISWEVSMSKEYVCGFRSLRQLCRWFTKQELLILMNNGFNVCVYETFNVKLGKTQIAFIKGKKINLETWKRIQSIYQNRK